MQLSVLKRGIFYRFLQLLFLFSTFYFTQAQADTRGQKRDPGSIKVSVSGNNIMLRDVFKAIQQQTGMTLMYNSAASGIDGDERITINFKGEQLDNVLAFLFTNRGLVWMYNDLAIVVRKKVSVDSKKKELDSSITRIPTLTGKVADADGNPIVGATVLVKRTQNGASTDANGNFSLSDVQSTATLAISSVGYESREVPVKGTTILVRLNLDIKSLDETVVKGYYNTTKRLNTGSVSTVKGEEINNQPVTNILSTLAGRVPGLFIQQNTGVPGGDFTIRIRGRNSIDNGNDPLFIIDGVPFATQSLSASSTSQNIFLSASPLSSINNADIERIEVLKDADATAIYGSRGANGVILITTKKGKAGATKIDINMYSGIGNVAKKLDLLDRRRYLDMRYEALKNDGIVLDPSTQEAYDLTKWDTTRSTDWQRLLIGGTAKIYDAQVSVSGGSTNTQFLLGLGYHRETAVFPGTGADQKMSAHFSISHATTNQRLRLLLTSNFVFENNQLPTNDLTGYTVIAPVAPQVYTNDGKINFGLTDALFDNPLAYTAKKYKADINNLISNLVVSYSVLNGLDAKINLGYTSMIRKEVHLEPRSSLSPFDNSLQASSKFGDNSIATYIIEPQINYKRTIGRGKLELLVGGTIQRNQRDGLTYVATGFSSDALIENPLAATSKTINNYINTTYKYAAMFGRINYNFKDKYLLNLTGRRDGSSRFGPGKQFANFGAVGIGWIFSKEDFIENISQFLSYGKIRASYGTTGNDQISDYQYLDSYTSYFLTYQGVSGLYPVRLFNSDFAWERNKKLEVGLELGMVNDRVLLGLNYFLNRSSNQLINYNLPTATGFVTIQRNLPAIVQNTGFEFELNTTNVQSTDFNWNSSLNFTIPRNKLISFPGLDKSSYANKYSIGKPLSLRNVYSSSGVNQQTGIYEFRNKDGDNTSDPSSDDRHFIEINQDLYGGLQNSIRYKNFDLTIFFQFVKQHGPANYFGTPGLANINQPVEVMQRWKTPGNQTSIQKFTQSTSSEAYSAYQTWTNSESAFTDASYVRLKNLSFSYQVIPRGKKSSFVKNYRIYLQGQNLFTITQYKGFDPETASISILPPLRMIALGIQLSLQ